MLRLASAELVGDVGDRYCKSGGDLGEFSCPANEAILESVRGNKEKTKTLEALAFGKITKVEHLRSSGSHVFVLTMCHRGKESKAIFKIACIGPGGENRELAAVGISEIAGFGVVPLGLLRTISIAGKEYTGFIQEFIPGKELMQVDHPVRLVESEEHYKRYNLILLFNELARSGDHSPAHHGMINNWYLGNNNLLYSIDHQFLFPGGSTDVKGEDFINDGQIPIDAAEAIVKSAKHSARLADFASSFSFFRSGTQNFLQKKLKTIAKSIEFKGGGAYIRSSKKET